jgi:hypothetical protein
VFGLIRIQSNMSDCKSRNLVQHWHGLLYLFITEIYSF